MIPLLTIIFCVIAIHVWLFTVNPYAKHTLFKNPYETFVTKNGEIDYEQHYQLRVRTHRFFDFLGYYTSGLLILRNRLCGTPRLDRATATEVIDDIHTIRFNPTKPYLISGDHFCVLYPRNLGVFYNQLLDPNTAHSEVDWENRQRLYLQSVLFAIDGLCAAPTPVTTLVPIGRKTIAATHVHPGSIASDAVYGLLYALQTLNTPRHSSDNRYHVTTQHAAQRILDERSEHLKRIVTNYLTAVTDETTGLVRDTIILSSARDGVHRRSSFYDNILLWKTQALAHELGIVTTQKTTLNSLRRTIKKLYWNELGGYYANDTYDASFSSDWLIGYVTDFFDLRNTTDLARTIKSVEYVRAYGLDHPLPIKYQIGKPEKAPWFVRTFVSDYGGEAIWSYWGAEFMTLLINMSRVTGATTYAQTTHGYRTAYDAAIVRDGGFAETFSPDGKFLVTPFYTSIRITGWVVQYEHALFLLNAFTDESL